MSKTSKRYIVLCVIFCAVAILFTVLYSFNLIKTLDLMLTVVYVTYFVGLALLYNSGYAREKNHHGASLSNVGLGFLFLIASVGLLIYGMVSGDILLF